MLHRLRIEGGRVRYRSRFVQSDAYRRSIATGVPVKGEFGSPNPASLWARLLGTQGTDNPAVVMSRHGARWIAVTETPFLTYFDPETLATEERVDLHGGELGLHFMAAHGYTLADGSYLSETVISETAFTTCRACACTWLIAVPAFCACSTPAATRSTPCFMLATAVAVPD